MAQEFVSRRDEDREVRSRAGLRMASAEASERVVALYPGESREIIVRVYGPVSHVVAVEEQGFPGSIASLEVAPKQAEAPFNSVVTVSVAPDATPGVYPWKLIVRDVVSGESLGQEAIVLVVLPKRLSKNVARHIVKLGRVYEKYGIQVALWAALRALYPNGARFSTVWELYQLLTRRRTSKGTVGNTLRIMVRKGLLEKRHSLYIPLNIDPNLVFSRVDIRRVRYPWQVLRKKEKEEHREKTRDPLEEYRFNQAELPQPVRRAYAHARSIAEKHGPLAALYFMLYTLLGARQTGHLLLWYNGWFIILEPKTGFAHHFYSWLLHWMLTRLGIEEGIYCKSDGLLHREAQKTAQRYIREIYGSHQNARRLHYMLWERNLAWSDEDVYTVKVYRYPRDDEVGVQILDKGGSEELYSVNLREEPARIEVYTALPTRHVDERNEETYFHRPAGLL